MRRAPRRRGWGRFPAVEMLRSVLIQSYTRTVSEDGREVIKQAGSRRRRGDGFRLRRSKIASPYDADVRGGARRGT